MTSPELDRPERRSESLRAGLVRLLGIEIQQKDEIYLTVSASATLRDGTYWLEILFSAGIATLGLILNSPAVIIGAMLISPLMGPILAIGLALASGDLTLAMRSLTSLFLSALLAVGFATLLVILLPFREMTAEIAARTRPNTLDLVIALFSGAVGSVATCKKIRGVATSIPGVAIAVALMPPLCVVGYGVGLLVTLDRAQGEAVVRGGGLLFLTNLVAITFTSMLVFLLFHIDSAGVRDRVRAMRADRRANDLEGIIERIPLPKALASIGSLPGRLLLVAAFILALFFPLSRSFDSLKKEITSRQAENRIQRVATALWKERFALSPDGKVRSYIDTFSATRTSTQLALHLRIFTSHPYSAEERAAFVERLAAVLQRPPGSIEFSLVEIPTSSYEVANRSTPRQEVAPPPAISMNELLNHVRERVDGAVATVPLPPPALLESHALTVTPDGAHLEIGYVSARDIDEDAQTVLAGQFQRAVDSGLLRVGFHRVLDSLTVQFGRRERTVPPSQVQPLRSISALVGRHPSWHIVVEGDSSDSSRDDRLNAIRAALIETKLDPARIRIAEASAPRPPGTYLLSIAASTDDQVGTP